MNRLLATLSVLCAGLVLPCPGATGEPDLTPAIRATGLSSGLAVVLGGADGNLEKQILAMAPDWLVLSLGGDVASADARRSKVGDRTGRMVVQPHAGGAIPVYNRSAALLLVDADALGGLAPDAAEIARALRPFGTALVKRAGRWSSSVGEWPLTIADASHWLGDERLASQVPDAECGPVRSLQWHTGREGLTGHFLWAAGGIAFSEIADGAGRVGVAGFDAFSGLQLWHRPDLGIVHNYAVAMDRERIVLHATAAAADAAPRRPAKVRGARNKEGKPQPLIALDVRTGNTLVTYDEGPDLAGAFGFVNLHGGRLVVASGDSLFVLDAASGKRLWSAVHPGKQIGFPVIHGDRVTCTIGGELYRTATHGPALDREWAVEAVVSYALGTGEEVWRWTQDAVPDGRSTAFMFSDRKLWLSLGARHLPSTVVCLDPATGAQTWMAKHEEVGPSDRYIRLFPFGDLLILNRGAPDFAVLDRTTGAPVAGRISSVTGGCLAPRASAKLLYHGTTSITPDRSFAVHRAQLQPGRCSRGAFPGQGLLFATDVRCDCDPFIRGLSAYGSEDPPAQSPDLTVAGPGVPGKELPGDAWRTAMRDAARSGWSPSVLAGELALRWSVAPGPARSASPLLGAQWERHWTASAVGGPVVGDGVVVVTFGHAHQIVALDPATGKERWRHQADSRIDGPATLASGVVLYGTASGWIEALSVADGRTVWRTRVAPGGRFRVENGQVESSHPVPASVVVSEGKVYAMAGVHSQIDGGLRWAELDLASGKTLRSGGVGGEPGRFLAGQKSRPGFPPESVFSQVEALGDGKFQKVPGTYPSSELEIAYPLQRAGILTLTPEGWLGLGVVALDPGTGGILRGGREFGFVNPGHWGINLKFAPRYPVSILDGLLSKDGDQVIMAGVRAKAIAYRGDELVAVCGSDDEKWRYDPKASLIARHRVRPDGGTTLLWKVPLEIRRGGGEGRNESKDGLRERTPPEAMAVAADCALVAENRQLRVFDLADGRLRQTLPLPAPAAQAGIAIAGGQVFVSCLDGTILSFGTRRE